MVGTAFCEGVREIGGGTLGVLGTLASFFGGIGESLPFDKEDCIRPAVVSVVCQTNGLLDPPPPEPVLLIDSPPVAVSEMLPGTGDGAADFEAPTFRI